MTLAQLIVKVGADVSEFVKNFEGTVKTANKTARELTDVGRTLSTRLTLPLLAVGGASVKMAMDAVESENLFSVSMGDMADSARSWSEDLRKTLGLNSYELRKNVGMFNAMFSSMGMGKQAAFDMSTGLTKLAYDMASFYNLKPEEAIQKLQAGISGETEPLKRLGIVINETTVQQYALQQGWIKQGQTLTEQQKIQARFNLIMEQTKQAQGDLARTIDSPTNQLRVLGEQVKNTAIDLGMALIPAFSAAMIAVKGLVERVQSSVQWFANLTAGQQQTIIVVLALVAALGPAIAVVGNVIQVISALGKAMLWLNANPIALVILGIAGLVAVVALLIKHWDDVKAAAENVWGAISKFLDTTLGRIVTLMSGPIGIGLLIIKNWNEIRAAAEVAWNGVKAAVEVVLGPINAVIGAIQSAIDWFNKLRGAQSNVPVVPPPPGSSNPGKIGPIPKLAAGGIVTRPTLALVGEAGPEVVAPLGSMGGLGSQTIIIELDGRELSRRVLREMPGQVRLKLGVV